MAVAEMQLEKLVHPKFTDSAAANVRFEFKKLKVIGVAKDAIKET